MDRQIQLHQNQQLPQTDQENNSNGGSKGSFFCRQSSTRWTPTTDQIRILKELYYTNGLRSPTAEQIQRISARLRQYGKIEDKNVFYWFQNHKARKRQKKRLNDEVPMQNYRNVSNLSYTWKPEEDYPKYSNFTTPGGGTNSCFGESLNHSYGGVTADQYGSSYTLSFDRRNINSIPTLEDYEEDQQEEEEEGVEAVSEIETLPLFPIRREDINAFCGFKQNSGNCYFRNWYGSDDHGNSLELSLNSHAAESQDFI